MKKKTSPNNTEHNSDNYWTFLFQKAQLTDWITVLVSCLVGYVFIRVCYPMPATFPDAFSYVAAAQTDQFSIYRPFGYSAFLQIIHALSSSVHAVIIAQFILYALSIGLFMMALKRYYPIHLTWLRLTIEVLVTLAPVCIYMLNALMSDVLFCCLILIMLAMLMVFIYDYSWLAAGIYLATFFGCLFVRYSAMFFPIAFIPILALTGKPVQRLVTIGMTCLLFGIFYQNITRNMKETIHHAQFSTGFDGWQLANNGLHVLPFIEDGQQPDNKRLREFHQIMQYQFKDMITEKTDSGRIATAAFLWDKEGPLKQYLFYYMQTTRTPYPIAWARLGGSLYADYGKWLIMHYPMLFWKHYLAPNCKDVFYTTRLEMAGKYTEIPIGQKEMATWYNIDTTQAHPANYPFYEKHLKAVLPMIELLTWLLFIGAFVIIIIKRQSMLASRSRKIAFAMLFVFGFIYYGTTTFASPISIRYWMPMHALKLAFVWMLLSQWSYNKKNQQAI